jgi:uncharacterized membrane protein YdbT with pleckstrin-like domain
MSWRNTVLRVMRVPHTPAAPPGSPPRTFRAAPNYFKLRMIRWIAGQFLAIFGLVSAVIFLNRVVVPQMHWTFVWLFRAGEIFGAIALAFEILFGWMIVRLDFELRWYMLSDRAIRIRDGITTIREKTIVLANIQNISVKQGPLQRALGIADVEVRTAGGGGGGSASDSHHKGVGEPMHVAYFRGVDNAEEIRDLLREGVRRQRDAGLGDPDEVVVEVPQEEQTRAAVAELLQEARALKQSAAALSG